MNYLVRTDVMRSGEVPLLERRGQSKHIQIVHQYRRVVLYVIIRVDFHLATTYVGAILYKV